VFDLDQLIADCVEARSETESILAVKEVLDRALTDDAQRIADALPPTVAEFTPLHTSAEITIAKVVWAPSMSVPPHDHLMWAVNGVYGGAEDNVFYRRAGEGIVESGGRRVGPNASAMLGADIIHAVTNPSPRAFTGAIHIYGGDYLNKDRSIWDTDTLEEGPADGDTIRRLFDEARERWS
jgi:predicted metal-dependent enzyme (double-stranded beta helix superfamily)